MFTPIQWADPAFLTFVKEYWEFNFKEKFKNVTVTIVFYIAPDNAEVTQDILVHFEVAGGQITPRLLLGKKMSKMTNAIFFAGNPATWRKAAQTGSIEALQGRAVIPDDNFKFVKAEISKTFFAIGNRVADRMAQGARPSISIADSIKYDEPVSTGIEMQQPTQLGVPGSLLQPGNVPTPQKPAIEMLDEVADFQIKVGGVSLMGRKELHKMFLNQELKLLREHGPKKMDKFWQQVEGLPIKENYRHVMNIMELPIQLLAAPELRPELLALRGKESDSKKEFKLVEDFLVKKAAAA